MHFDAAAFTAAVGGHQCDLSLGRLLEWQTDSILVRSLVELRRRFPRLSHYLLMFYPYLAVHVLMACCL